MRITGFTLLLCVGLAGCATFGTQRRSSAMRDSTRLANIETSVQQLQERVEGVAVAQQSMHASFETLHAQDMAIQQLQKRLDVLESSVRALDASQKKMHDDIIKSLSQKISQVLARQGSGGSGRRVQNGWEHVVEPRQTLSQIAQAYGTTVDAIVKANNLKSADTIRVGQKLFIPE